MNTTLPPASAAGGGWTRPEPTRIGPDRAVGGFYRSADRLVDGAVQPGVPLTTREDVAVAAVKAAYKIADGYVERGLNIAQHLRETAGRHGAEPRDMLDGSERLAGKALTAALQWFEGAMQGDGHPLRRLLSAEYDMVGSFLGLREGREGRDDRAGRRGKGGKEGKRGKGDAPAPPPATAPAPAAATLRIRNGAARELRRPVLATHLALPHELQQRRYDKLYFVLAGADASVPGIDGELAWDADGRATLAVDTLATHPRGEWVSGIYDEDGVQLGTLAIEL